MAKPDGLVAAQALGPEPVQQVHLSLSHGRGEKEQQGRSRTRAWTRLRPGRCRTCSRIPKKLYGLLGPGVRVASTQTKE